MSGSGATCFGLFPTATAAEALALGIRAGADPETLFKLISESAGSSWMWQNRVPPPDQPPAQYVQPASCARFTPHTPEGMTVIPGTTFAAHSFAAASALMPAT